MLIVAVTGGIGSGKSTAAALFNTKGIPSIDTDIIARQLVKPDQPLLSEIIKQFGHQYLNDAGELDRRALREHVFSHPQARLQLEALMHPAIYTELTQQLQTLDAAYCLIMIPLLARSQQTYPHDRVLLVDAPDSLRIKRTAERDRQDPQFIQQIMHSQPTRDEMLACADDVLDNSGDKAALAAAVESLHQRYLTLASQGN